MQASHAHALDLYASQLDPSGYGPHLLHQSHDAIAFKRGTCLSSQPRAQTSTLYANSTSNTTAVWPSVVVYAGPPGPARACRSSNPPRCQSSLCWLLSL